MRSVIKFFFLLSVFFPATLMVAMCLFGCFFILSEPLKDFKLLYLFIAFCLGILGYIGIILLVFEEEFKSNSIILFLSFGVIAYLFMIFEFLDGRFFLFEDEGFLSFYFLHWPVFAAIFSIIRLVIRAPSKEPANIFP